jgi:hypothetical protein
MRFMMNLVVVATLEATYGVSATPVGADALLLSNVSINPLRANNVSRDLVRGYHGASPQLVGTSYVEITGTFELAGSGTATTPPKWGRLMQCMGFAQTVGAASVDYTPISTYGANSSVTMFYFLDGIQHQLLGVRGTWELVMNVGGRPEMRCRFIGKYGGVAVVANPTPDYTAFRDPIAVTDANTGDLLIGAVTYTAGTGTIASGTAYISTGLQLSSGNNLVFQPLLGEERVLITQREVTGSISLDLANADVVTFMNAVRANTLTAMGMVHGTTAGNKVGVYSPSFQRLDPALSDQDGVVMNDFSVRLLPVSGNDELRIVVS